MVGMHTILQMNTMPKDCIRQMEHVAKFKIARDYTSGYYALSKECNYTLTTHPKPGFMTYPCVAFTSQHLSTLVCQLLNRSCLASEPYLSYKPSPFIQWSHRRGDIHGMVCLPASLRTLGHGGDRVCCHRHYVLEGQHP